jgi:general secretion pathway protein C
MQNVKYHAINVISVILFSYLLAVTANQVVKSILSPSSVISSRAVIKPKMPVIKKSFEDYKSSILDTGLFQVADPNAQQGDGAQVASSAIEELTLLGTVTGPASIARALIQKKGEANPGVFALYKINSEISNDVYGNKLIRIDNFKVWLDAGGNKVMLDMYGTVQPQGSQGQTPSSGQDSLRKTISRAEIRQQVLNNVDNAMRGVVGGPNWGPNGQVTGWKLTMVRPFSFLYKLGARSGDIIKRINGKAIDSSQKMLTFWDAFKSETKITVDLDRSGKVVTYEFNISE